jgi:hypothetical protein
MIFTTNYDDVLERCLDQAGLPYHLFSYQTDGANQGLFYHVDVEGSVRLIERPRNIRRLADGFVVVKLDGGVDGLGRIPESYVTTQLDFWSLAARIPEALPAVVQERLLASPLLMLGHGLATPEVESLARFAHRDHAGLRSWAVVLRESGAEYWQQCGVEIINTKVEQYVRELTSRLRGNAGAAS